MSKVLTKLDMNAAPGPSGLRNGHIRIWAGIFVPPDADEAIQWLEMLLTDMANNKLPSMQAIQAAELMTVVKAETKLTGGVADHKTGTGSEYPGQGGRQGGTRAVPC